MTLNNNAAESVRIAVVYYSGYGHTKILAESVASGAGSISGVHVDIVDVERITEESWLLLDSADALIFGSPTYIGGVAGPFKCFIDATSARFKVRHWAGKIAGGFTVSSSKSGDNFGTLQQLSTFALQQGMIWVGVGLLPGWNSIQGSEDDLNRLGSMMGAAAQANEGIPPEDGVVDADRRTAAHLGVRVAVATRRWLAGQRQESAEYSSQAILEPLSSV